MVEDTRNEENNKMISQEFNLINIQWGSVISAEGT